MANMNTAHLQLPLPHPDNLLESDVLRISASFVGLDAYAAVTDTQLENAALAIHALQESAAALTTRTDTLESDKVESTDHRLSDARTPTAHADSHKIGGMDALKAKDIGGVTPEQLPQIDGASLVLDGGVWKVSEAWLALKAPQPQPVYTIGEFKSWFEQNPPEGWAVRNGAMLVNATTAYPKLWEYLHKPENAWKCKTLAQWNALSSAAGGVGGVPFFAVDDTSKTIKLPDTRGDYARCAGSTYLQAVGEWHDSAIVNITGSQGGICYGQKFSSSGSLWVSFQGVGPVMLAGNYYGILNFDAGKSQGVKIASDNRTRTYGMLGCVCVGMPT